MNIDYVNYIVKICLKNTLLHDINCIIDENFMLMEYIFYDDDYKSFKDFKFNNVDDLENKLNNFANEMRFILDPTTIPIHWIV